MNLLSYAGKDEVLPPPTGKELFKMYNSLIYGGSDTPFYDIADGLLDDKFLTETEHMDTARRKSVFVHLFARNFGFEAWVKDRQALTKMADTLYETILIDRALKNAKRAEGELSVSDFSVIVDLVDDEADNAQK
jgi:hypothetical protein